MTGAADGEEVRTALRRESADLVVIHISLALERRGELLTWMRRLEAPPKIIAVGSHDEPKLTERLRDLGVSAYLPVWRVADDLLATVERVLVIRDTQTVHPADDLRANRGRLEYEETTPVEDGRRTDKGELTSRSAKAGKGETQ